MRARWRRLSACSGRSADKQVCHSRGESHSGRGATITAVLTDARIYRRWTTSRPKIGPLGSRAAGEQVRGAEEARSGAAGILSNGPCGTARQKTKFLHDIFKKGPRCFFPLSDPMLSVVESSSNTLDRYTVTRRDQSRRKSSVPAKMWDTPESRLFTLPHGWSRTEIACPAKIAPVPTTHFLQLTAYEVHV